MPNNSESISVVFTSFNNDDNGFTLIGDEHEFDLMDHCSIVSSSFKGEQLIGQLAIVGPTRLPYHKIKNTLNILNIKFDNYFNEDDLYKNKDPDTSSPVRYESKQ